MDIDKFKEAKDHYYALGYDYIDVPWHCSMEAMNNTLPEGSSPCSLVTGNETLYMVGSAEQSFIQMLMDETLPQGKFQTITPCFREDPEDDLHKRYFMKLELFETNTFFGSSAEQMFLDAATFFNRYLRTEVITTDSGWDLRSRNQFIELGSYGYRVIKTKSGAVKKYAYGTGLAQPRLNYAISIDKT